MAKYTIIFVINFLTEFDKNASNQSSRHTLMDKISNKDDHPNGMFVFNLKDTVKQYVHIKCKNFTQQISNIYITCAGKVAKVGLEFENIRQWQGWKLFIYVYIFNYTTIQQQIIYIYEYTSI